MRLVDADAAVERLGNWLLWAMLNGKSDDPDYKDMIAKREAVLEAFKAEPTAPPPYPVANGKEVLRCKDCKNCNAEIGYSHDFECWLLHRTMPLDGYCSLVTPKEKETKNAEKSDDK